MTDETQNPGCQDLAVSPIPPSKPAKRPKPGPGRHGSGRITTSACAPAPTPSAIHSAAPKPIPTSIASPAPAPTPNPSLAPAPAPATKPLARPPSKPAPKRKLPAVKAAKLGPLGLEETISIATALTVLRGPFFVLHVETTGRDPDHNEILAISAMRVEEGVPMAEFSVHVSEHGVSVQKAVTMLCAFLVNRRQHVFAHGAEAAQALLGPAARQYGLQIENPIGDVVDLAKLAWPGRTDYSLSGLAADLRLASRSAPEAPDATKALLGVLRAASKQLTTTGGRVSSSLVHWGNSEDCVRIRMTPW